MKQTKAKGHPIRVIQLYAMSALGIICNASAMVFMPLYIVDHLGLSPKLLATYNAINCITVMLFNHLVSHWIEKRLYFVIPIIGSAFCLLFGSIIAFIFIDDLEKLLLMGFMFGLSASSIATFYSFASHYAEYHAVDRDDINTKIRSVTSISWAVAPNLVFFVIAVFGYRTVFIYIFSISALWIVTLAHWFPLRFFANTSNQNPLNSNNSGNIYESRKLWFTTVLIFFISLSSSITAGSMSVFVVTELHLSVQTVGYAFVPKIATETLFIILSRRLLKLVSGLSIFAFCATLSVIYNFLLISSDSQSEIILISVIDGISYGLFVGTAINYMQTLSVGKISFATSMYMNALFAAAFTSGPIIGFIASEYSFKYCIASSAILSLFVFISISGTYVLKIIRIF